MHSPKAAEYQTHERGAVRSRSFEARPHPRPRRRRLGLAVFGATAALLGAACDSTGGDGGQAALRTAAGVVTPASDSDPMPGTVWVTNRSQHEVTAFDARSGARLMTVPVGLNPIGVVAPPGVGKVYVSNEDSNTVSVIAKGARAVVREVSIPTGNAKPHHLTASPNGRFVYVAEFGSHRVAVIDTDADHVVTEYDAGAPGSKTHAVTVSPDGKTLYAVNSGANELVALTADNGAREWSLPMGENPSEMVVAPGGRIGYVSVRNEHTVKVVDLATPAVIDEVRVGTEPDTLQLTNDAKTLVVALRGTPAYVTLVDTGDLTGLRWVELDGRTTGHQWLSADDRHTFVAVESEAGAGSLGVVDNRSGRLIAQHTFPGSARPHGVFYEPTTMGHGEPATPPNQAGPGM